MATGYNAAALIKTEKGFCTVWKVQLGTSVLLTSLDFNRLILCPIWALLVLLAINIKLRIPPLLCLISPTDCIPLIGLASVSSSFSSET